MFKQAFLIGRNIHFVGIGGSGMSGIAEVLSNYGFSVSGSDICESKRIKYLRSQGIKIKIGHSAKNVANADVVVYSSAVQNDNVEIKAAFEKSIPVIQRAEMLAELMRIQFGIAVAGSHGKTSTTSILGYILRKAGFDPTMVIGGIFKNIATGGYRGKGQFLVAEADESDASFLKLSPTFVIVCNIDDDHISFYGSFDHLKQAFVDFINSIPFYGYAVLGIDDPGIREILPQIRRRFVTYGFSDDADYKISVKKKEPFGTRYLLKKTASDKNVGEFFIPIPGLHNVLNSASAVILARILGIKTPKIKEALRGYRGVSRRFELKGIQKDVIVIDDYAHHPTEIKATIAAARQTWSDRRLVLLFQPHRYTRTKEHSFKLAQAVASADVVSLLPIYSAGEKEIPGITSQLIWENIPRQKRHRLFTSQEQACDDLAEYLKEGDVFITMGAGDVYKTGENILKKLRR